MNECKIERFGHKCCWRRTKRPPNIKLKPYLNVWRCKNFALIFIWISFFRLGSHDISALDSFNIYLIRKIEKPTIRGDNLFFHYMWKDETASKPKLWIKFKKEPKREDYMFLSRLERSLLAQLRLGIFPLKTETGRFVNLPLENRTCTLCDMIVLEDEVHFVTRCPLFKEIYRNQLFFNQPSN